MATRAAGKQDPAGSRNGNPALSGEAPANALPTGRQHNEGHGRRLTAAFEALEAFPALAESRKRVLRLVSQDQPSVTEMVTAIESDVALVIAVMRLANKRADGRGRVRSIPQAIEVLTPGRRRGADRRHQDLRLLRAHARCGTRHPSASACTPSRRSAPPTGSARAIEFPDRDELLVSSLLHDIGKLVLVQAYPGYPGQIHTTARTPEQRIHAERRELGIDHALVGGVMARRWGLPQQLAAAIEHHHTEDANGEAGARAARRHAGPLRAGPGDRPRPAAGGRAPASASARRTCARSCSSFPARRPTARRSTTPVPALGAASWRC